MAKMGEKPLGIGNAPMNRRPSDKALIHAACPAFDPVVRAAYEGNHRQARKMPRKRSIVKETTNKSSRDPAEGFFRQARKSA